VSPLEVLMKSIFLRLVIRIDFHVVHRNIPGIRDFYAQMPVQEHIMEVPSAQKRLLWSLIAISSGAILLLATISTSSDARVRHSKRIASRSTVTTTGAVQQPKPIKLRYYGGPKYPMYPG
jgi:hypothetical protein